MRNNYCIYLIFVTKLLLNVLLSFIFACIEQESNKNQKYLLVSSLQLAAWRPFSLHYDRVSLGNYLCLRIIAKEYMPPHQNELNQGFLHDNNYQQYIEV